MAGQFNDLAPFLIASGEVDAHGNAHQSPQDVASGVVTTKASVNDAHNTALNASRASVGVEED